MDMKHANELQFIENCPFSGAKQLDGIAYRFVFENGDHEKNFTCPAKRNPRRMFDDNCKCSSLALSFYENKQSAKDAYLLLSKLMKNIRKTIGDSIAEVRIIKDDGVAGTLDNQGHFDFWESVTATFNEQVVQIEVFSP